MTDASLIYEIDSSQARTAATDLAKLQAASGKLASEFAKSDKALRDSNGRFKSSAKVVEEYGGEVRRLAAEFNPALNAVYKFQDAEERLSRAVALGVLSIDQKNSALDRVRVQLASAAAAQNKFGQAAITSGNHVANLGYQINDIGMMMALGQSPFALMMQQGPQVAQIFSDMAVKGQKIGPTLADAFSRMINPMTALTLVAIGGATALVQWGMSALGAGEDAKTFRENVDELKSSVTEVNNISKIYSSEGLTQMRDKYGEINAGLLAMIENQRSFATNEAMARATAAAVSLGEAYGITSINLDAVGRAGMGSQIALGRMATVLGLSRDEAKDLAIALKDASSAVSFEAKVDALSRVNAIISKSKDSATDLAKATLDAEDAMRQLAKSAPQASWMNAAISGVLSLGNVIRDRIIEANELRRLANAPGMTTGTPLFEGGYNGIRLPGSALIPTDKEFGIKPDKKGGGGGGGAAALRAAEKGFQNIRELLEKESLFQVAEYEKRQAQLDAALAKKLLSEKQYQEMKAQLSTFYFGTEYEKRQLQYDMDLEQLRKHLEDKKLTRQQYDMAESNLAWGQVQKLGDADATVRSQQLSHMAQNFADMNAIAGGGYDSLLRAQKIFGAASALISTYTGAAEALKLPFPYNMMAAGKIIAAGLGFVSAIKGGGKGASGTASSATSAASAAKSAPEKQIFVRLEGPDWMVDMADSVISQIYEQSRDGRVVISKAGS